VKKQYAIFNMLLAFVILCAAFIPANQPIAAADPDIPAIIDRLNFGVAAGNGYGPQRLALDSQRRQLYTLNNGLAELGEGNTISVMDLSTNQVTALLRLENLPSPGPLQPTPARPGPLDLQVDPYRPRLYALTGDPYASPPYTNLTIIDRSTQRIVDTLPGVLAVVPGPDQLYLASATRLWAADPNSMTELLAFDLQSPISNSQPFLLLNPEANRLYLGERQSGSLTVFAADSLSPVDSYAGSGPLVAAVVDETGQRVWIIDNDGTQLTLRALNSDGQPLATPPPFVLTGDVYSDPHLALAGSSLVVSNRTSDASLLQIFNPATLALSASLTIPDHPTDLAADPATGQLYLTYSDARSYVLAVDSATGAADTLFTAVTISDALADPAADRLYILNNERTLRALRLTDYGSSSAACTPGRPSRPPV
jgi:DNA-binding beta-propeller fold protein YncE